MIRNLTFDPTNIKFHEPVAFECHIYGGQKFLCNEVFQHDTRRN